jgi:acetone carboxylase, beta subunit
MKRTASVFAIDAGGTMTDTIVIDENGGFTIGKASSSPKDESIAFTNSVKEALSFWNTDPESIFPSLVGGVYSGTAMLNRLLEKRGPKVGLLVSAGMEDYLLMERAIQTYAGYHYADRLHAVTHVHNEPIIPKQLIFGITERFDQFGKEVIPLYEHDVKQAIEG